MDSDIGQWMVQAALAGEDEVAILAGTCERMNAQGMALVRASVASDLLDPTFDSRGILWTREQGGFAEAFLRADGEADENWRRSPFFALVERRAPMLRRRLGTDYRRGEFPMLDRFQDQGVTDYVALLSVVGANVMLGEAEGLVASFTTDTAAGFTDAQIALLQRVLPLLTLTMTLRTVHRTARTLLTTYLGSDAAERVLAGNIVRGRADPIFSVVWYSDLTGFTRIADAQSSATTLALLNEYAEAQVEEIEAQGGHVLKFIGDGILAIFPQEDTSLACRCALAAAQGQRRRIDALNARRTNAGLPVTSTHVALHVGELLYGNLGSARRLDFTVLGSAVNEVARIEALCASLDQPIVVSSAFAQAAGTCERLVSLGRYAMKGVSRPQEMFTLDPEP